MQSSVDYVYYVITIIDLFDKHKSLVNPGYFQLNSVLWNSTGVQLSHCDDNEEYHLLHVTKHIAPQSESNSFFLILSNQIPPIFSWIECWFMIVYETKRRRMEKCNEFCEYIWGILHKQMFRNWVMKIWQSQWN